MSITSVRSVINAFARGSVVSAIFALAIVLAPNAAFASISGTPTIGAQTPNPVISGNSATYSVTTKANNSSHDTKVTVSSGLPIGATASSDCVISDKNASTHNTLSVSTNAATTPAGSSVLHLTVTMYQSANGTCSNGVQGNNDIDTSKTATLVVSAPAATTGSLTVTTSVVGGSAAIADFPLTLDGMSITSGTATTTSAASHTVAAGSVANYAATFGGNCNTSGQVTVPAGSSASCTVTETYSAPALTAQTITVTTHAPASAANGTSFPVAATASSGLTVAITATGGCTIAGGTVTMNSDTTACVVHYNQAGDSTYSAAPEVTETTTASAAAPACALDASNDLINNPCLETGTPGTLTLSGSNVQTGTGGPDNWFIYNAGIEGTATYPASTFHSGTKAASVTITSVTDPTHEHDAQWGFDTVNVTADTNYQFSFWYNSTVDIEVDGEYDDAANKATYTQVRSNLPATNGQWKQFTTNIIPPKGTTHMSIVPLISQPGTLTVDDFQLQKMADPSAFSAGMVSLNFDDGLASFWDNATSTLNAAGLKATAYIITGSSGSSLPNSTPNGGYLSQAQIQALYAAGYDIGDHTTSHPYLTTVSDLNAEINDSVSALSTAIGVPVTTLAYPYGDYNSAVETQVQGVTAAQGGPLLAARSVEDGYNDKATDPDALRIKEIFDTTTVAQVESWIDDANTNHEWLVLLMHDVQATCPNTGTECITVANLKTIADYLNSSHTNTVTMSQGVAAMNG